ncbi:RagB/SusD family nutrient uptake outer membrane protein [Sphingobacterium siyangense]|uniref:RagB/SusD family nutrient uptake outer membrane protein n=1 Tax=Sphingobacterium siyangense TaxID=459529 RepID=UPI0019665889|nr:RagB/SusD family nutrient uptake outer membrane protein [Sphingobacterium siyangense]QRY55942.1 RagB/SusD family nutrient uptake outer membrane protein [Sphingobacterium siyangense]
MKNKIIVFVTIVFFCLSCKKGWLEEKQDIKLIVPTTLNDLDLLLNVNEFQYDGRGAGETSSDDYEFTLEQFNQLFYGFDRDFIVWKTERNLDNLPIQQNEWKCAYTQIQICNVVLKRLSSITRTENNKADFDRIYGTALYHRSKQFLNMVMSFSKYYDKNTSNSDLGIPIKLDDDIAEEIKRATVEQTYQQIIQDLKLAAHYLPVSQIDYSRVAKGGAFALLSRTFLFMDNYNEAKKMADSSLKYHSFVEDFNLITNTSGSRPLNLRSKEIHVSAIMVKPSSNPSIGRINSSLYNQYEDSDLRKMLFFRKESDGKVTFRGHFMNNLFTGTTTGEVLLILAECKARLGDKNGALEALNTLEVNRYKKTEFIPFTAISEVEALKIILQERRKELLTRGLRWQDLKRFNRDPQFAQTLVRRIGNETYSLAPNDVKFVLPIPQFVINFNKIQQNQY